MKIAVLAGDGIGVEIVEQATNVLKKACQLKRVDIELLPGLVGGAAYEVYGHPLPQETLNLAEQCDAILFGAVGDWKYDSLHRTLRPEQAILGLRKHFDLFANLRPAILYPELAFASTLKEDVVSGLDLMIIRELTGDVYFGQPRGRRQVDDGKFKGAEEGFDTMRYSVPEVERIAHIAFQAAQKRQKRLCSVDKANVLETSQLWRDVMTKVAQEYPDVTLSHMYVDNVAMQLVKNPKQFDVMVTGNLFGDILSDQASMLTGSIGMLPSASLNQHGFGLYEPSHGSAPDIAGKGLANPIATILSVAMMMRYSLKRVDIANLIEQSVMLSLHSGMRTADLISEGTKYVSTIQMGEAIEFNLDKVIV